MKVGIVIRLTDDPALGRAPTYRQIRERTLAAEAAGFDAIWLYDHLLSRRPDRPDAGTWEGWTVLTALAEATNRVQLGPLVICVPFRNPAILAKMAATLDEISGGRLMLGLGAGWHEPEFTAFDVPFDHLGSRFAEALAIIAPLVREGNVDFTGRFAQARDCVILPPGPRQAKGGIPIHIAGGGPRMLRLAARWADAWNTAWLGDPGQLADRRAALDAACAEVGRDPAAIATTVGVTIAFPDLAELPKHLTEHPENYLGGTPAELAASFRAYEALDVEHLICAVTPPDTEAAFNRLVAGLRAFREIAR